jgi:hypothetical protein
MGRFELKSGTSEVQLLELTTALSDSPRQESTSNAFLTIETIKSLLIKHLISNDVHHTRIFYDINNVNTDYAQETRVDFKCF